MYWLVLAMIGGICGLHGLLHPDGRVIRPPPFHGLAQVIWLRGEKGNDLPMEGLPSSEHVLRSHSLYGRASLSPSAWLRVE